jgi:sorbitol/mannitol transport system substrate-binding protein
MYKMRRSLALSAGPRASRKLGNAPRRRKIGFLAGAIAMVAALGGTYAGFAQANSVKKSGKTVTIKIAIESNSNMLNIENLIGEFYKLYPGIKVDFDTLNENNERALVETDVSTHANEFNAVMISNYETPIWAKNGWLQNLTPALTADTSYDINDLLKPIRDSLSYKGNLYSVPFYGESSMLYYRKSILAAAGETMPLHPTWAQVAAIAAKVNTPSVAGICLRGVNGWGDNLAVMDTIVNTFGGSWFNDKWQPQLTSTPDEQAWNFYVNLIKAAGESGASQDNFPQCETLYGEGKAAMWYDATVAAGLITTTYPTVGADTGYAYAPTGNATTGASGVHSGWLYTWSLSIPKGVGEQADTLKFLEWATSKQYLDYSGTQTKVGGQPFGWADINPGTRYSTYSNPNYQKAAAAFYKITLNSINTATPAHSTDPNVAIPYGGVQFVDEPWFINLGNEVSNNLEAAIAGTETVTQALATSQTEAKAAVTSAGLLK